MKFTAAQIAKAKGVSIQSITTRAKKEDWPKEKVKGSKNQRWHYHYILSGLPSDVQVALVRAFDLSPDLPDLSAAAAVELISDQSGGESASIPSAGCAAEKLTLTSALLPTTSTNGRNGFYNTPVSGSLSSWSGCDASIINDRRVMKKVRILAECDAIPPGWNKTDWINAVAMRYGITRQTIYRWKSKQEENGLAGLKQTSSLKETATAWSEDALDFWIGLVLKRSHRKKSLKDLYYNGLIIEANIRGWKIGSYRSACEWAEKRITPALLKLQKGGVRALDNSCPPVRRNYSDLNPFQFIVGDQHRFDIWVIDEISGDPIRPEGYFWQDLRTRLWYGGAIDRRYDSHLMGLALHIGCRTFGTFQNLYTDNGKPEQSKYIARIVRDIRKLGMEAERTRDDIPSEMTGQEDEEDMPIVRIGQKFAIIKNAKAKMIEGSFRFLEQILINQFGVPGYVKKLGGDIHENDIDQAEVEKLARKGKLLTFEEFQITLYRALDWYNRARPHRGAYREWSFGPRPKEVRPADVLMGCYREGWRPRKVSPEALSLIFLPEKKPNPTIQKGRIEAFGDYWEAPDTESTVRLMKYEGQKMIVKYDPMALTELLVFGPKGEFVTIARPMTWGSMMDDEKTSNLIEQKRRIRKSHQELYHLLTSGIPDIRTFSETASEKAAALVGREKRRISRKRAEYVRTPSEEELAANVARIEHFRPESVRPAFRDERQRYEWILEQISGGESLADDDVKFLAVYEAGFDDQTREYYDILKKSLNIKADVG